MRGRSRPSDHQSLGRGDTWTILADALHPEAKNKRAHPFLGKTLYLATGIERMHGVRFGQTQVWRILGSLGFSPQKPEKRAIERDEDTVRHWQCRTWPALKKKPSGKAG